MDIWAQIQPILVSTLIGIMIVAIGYVGDKAKKLIPLVFEWLGTKINMDKAIKVWWKVDEFFRLHPELITAVTDKIEAKRDMFATELRKKIPFITDEQIEDLREAIAGEINEGKEVVQTEVTKYEVTPTTEETPAQ